MSDIGSEDLEDQGPNLGVSKQCYKQQFHIHVVCSTKKIWIDYAARVAHFEPFSFLSRAMRGRGMRLVKDMGKVWHSCQMEMFTMVTMPTEKDMDKYA